MSFHGNITGGSNDHNGSRTGSSVVNTILLVISLGVMGFIGRVSWSNSVDLSRLMTRQEVEKRVGDSESSVDRRISAFESRIHALEERDRKLDVMDEKISRIQADVDEIKRTRR